MGFLRFNCSIYCSQKPLDLDLNVEKSVRRLWLITLELANLQKNRLQLTIPTRLHLSSGAAKECAPEQVEWGRVMSDSKKGKAFSPKFLLAKEAAEYLRVKVRTLANWRARNTGPAWRKHGGKVVYTIEELDRYSDDEGKTHVG